MKPVEEAPVVVVAPPSEYADVQQAAPATQKVLVNKKKKMKRGRPSKDQDEGGRVKRSRRFSDGGEGVAKKSRNGKDEVKNSLQTTLGKQRQQQLKDTDVDEGVAKKSRNGKDELKNSQQRTLGKQRQQNIRAIDGQGGG